MQARRWLGVALCVLLASGCYHQVVQTGKAPGRGVVEHWFVSVWAWGLVPAKPIDVRRECPGGVATIMSETSVVNGVIAVLTLGIYTPQHVRVTCALQTSALPRGATEIAIPATASRHDVDGIVSHAIEHVAETGAPVVLRY
jgi:hypothetical protein